MKLNSSLPLDLSKYQDCGEYWLSPSVQGSDTWKKERSVLFTASNFASALNAGFKSRDKLITELSTHVTNNELNRDMQRGINLEPEAREYYEQRYNVQVRQVGLAIYKADSRIGASTDGLVGDDGIIEIKCPRTMPGQILEYIKHGDDSNLNHIYDSWYIQVQGNLAILNRKWCDLIVYVPAEDRVFVQRIKANPEYWTKTLYPAICKVLDEVTS